MKKIKIIYWTTTVLFAGFMTFSSIPDILVDADAKQFMTHLGYPVYILPFLGVAKVLGVIAIVIPAFPKVKEWAYAGLFFDLIGAVYSIIMVEGFNSSMGVMGLIFAVAIISYLYSKKYYDLT